MSDDTDPRVHWLTLRRYEWDGEGRAVSEPTTIAAEIDESRTQLAAEQAEAGATADEEPLMTELRALVTASVLKECAERLRLAAQTGDVYGSEAIAALADELASHLYHGTILRG